MNAAYKGRRAEHRARALLEAAGFAVCRAAGSKGPADLVAWDTTSIRFISVKSGNEGRDRDRARSLAVAAASGERERQDVALP